MSTISQEKLDRLIQRFATVEHDMSSGAVSGDGFVKLSKEYADLEPTAKKARELRKAYDERRDLDEMMKAGGELAEMAEAERQTEELTRDLEKLDAEWQQRLAAANIAESEADANVISMSNRIRDLKKSLGQAS